MRKPLLLTLLVLLAQPVAGQDATTALEAAEKAMGIASLQSIQYRGSGFTYFFGQAPNASSGWPRMILEAYAADVDYATPAMRQELFRTQPDGSVPFGGYRQIQIVSGRDAWNVSANNLPVAAPATAVDRRLQIWLTPPGFIKAAQANRATLAKKGPNKVVSFTTPDGFKVSGVINANNLVDRIDTAVDNAVLGDMPVEVTFANYETFGTIVFPATIVQKQGGHPVLELTVSEVKPDGAVALDVPAAMRGAIPPTVRADSQEIGEGVWHLTGGSHHSVLVEFSDHLVVIEAPQSEARSEVVIAEVRRLVTGKPIRYVVNTHQHFDHSGGLRTYAAAGATIITASIYKSYYEKAFGAPHTINPDQLVKAGTKAKIEGVSGKRVLSDGNQSVELHVLQKSPHNEGLLIAYLPKQKILVEADVFTPGAPNAPPPDTPDPLAVNLYENIERLKLDVEQIAPVHGRLVPIADLRRAIGR